MRIAVWILLLSAASAVLSNSTDESRMAMESWKENILQQLLRNIANCRVLSESFGAMAQHSASVPYTAFRELVGKQFSEETMETLFEMVFGFDIVNDDVTRKQYTCAISQSHSLSQLKQALEDNGLLHNWFRLAYDYISYGLPLGKQSMTEPHLANGVDMINALESAGLLNLDPDRVLLLADMFAGPRYSSRMAGYVPAAPYPADNHAKCNHVNNAFRSLVRETLNAHNGAAKVQEIQQITGLDFTDNGAMRRLFCDLVDGAENGVQGLYDAFDNHGIFSRMMEAVYPYVQIYEQLWRQKLEEDLEYLINIKPLISTIDPDYQLPGGPYYYNEYSQSPTKRNPDGKAKRVHANKAKASLEEKNAKSQRGKRHHDDTDKRHYAYKDKRGNGGQYAYGDGPNHQYGGGPGGYGYGGPGYAYPTYGGPDYGGPDYGGPDYGGPDYGGPGFGGPVSREEQIESIRLAIDFLAELERGNLLTLPTHI